MNHDACHCADYKSSCPRTCYRARLTKEYFDYGYPLEVYWGHMRETTTCPLNKEFNLNEDTVE